MPALFTAIAALYCKKRRYDGMQEIVDEVLKVEAGAEKAIGEANEKAASIKQQAEHEGIERINAARIEAQQLIKDKVAAAKDRAGLEYKKATDDALAKSLEFVQQNRKTVDLIVDKIVNSIITPELERD